MPEPSTRPHLVGALLGTAVGDTFADEYVAEPWRGYGRDLAGCSPLCVPAGPTPRWRLACSTGRARSTTVPAGVGCARFGRDDVRATIRDGVLLGGDTDTVVAMAGAIVGARVGVDGIAATWLARREACRPPGGDAAERLGDLSPTRPSG